MSALLQSWRRGWRSLVSRKMYLAAIILVPVLFSLFFIDLMDEGLPLKAPVSIVDLDQSRLSRQITHNLQSSELTDIRYKDLSFYDARDRVRRGETFGFFVIPEDFQKDALSGRKPTLAYYSNMTIFVPGTLSFKGFKSTAVTTVGGLVQTSLISTGLPSEDVAGLISPVAYQTHPLGNPWMNYAVYLCNSFIPCLIALMVMLVAVFSICEEIKHSTSTGWLRDAGGSLFIALTGKLAPQAILFSLVGICCQAFMFGYQHFPLNCPLWHMVLAMILLVVASQCYAVVICSFIPNLRYALSICSLSGILAFSIAGFSFPVEQMYGGIGIFAYILPIRWYFLIYIDQALNGIDLYYSRFYYISLLLFPLVALISIRFGRLRKVCLKPVYVP